MEVKQQSFLKVLNLSKASEFRNNDTRSYSKSKYKHYRFRGSEISKVQDLAIRSKVIKITTHLAFSKGRAAKPVLLISRC